MKKLEGKHYKALWVDAEERLEMLKHESSAEIKKLQQELDRIKSNPSQLRKDFELAAQQREGISVLLRNCELENIRLQNELDELRKQLPTR